MNSRKHASDPHDLIVRHLEGDLAPHEHALLNTLLRERPEVRALYRELIDRAATLRSTLRAEPNTTPTARTASAGRTHNSEIPTPGDAYVYATAALVAIATVIVGVYLFAFNADPSDIEHRPSNIEHPPLATLIESTPGSRLTTPGGFISEGRDYPRGEYALDHGSAEFMLTNAVNVKLHGETRLFMRNAMNVALTRGSAAFVVPTDATGFTVHLPDGSRIVDLGTAFTTTLDAQGVAHVSVTEGSVRVEGIDSQRTLAVGERARIVDGRIVELPPTFALDLVDLINGGDGRARRRGLAINTTTGHATTEPVGQADQFADATYRPTPDLTVVDGVFTPDGSGKPVRLDAAGHTYDGFRSTGGKTWGPLLTAPQLAGSYGAYVIDGVDYAAADRSSITMIPNRGVTVDLHAITAKHADAAPERFTAVVAYGVSHDELPAQNRGDRLGADLLVFIDGQLVFERLAFDATDGPIELDIPIPADARYLTLVTTDGGNSVAFDWVVIGDPTLETTSVVTREAERSPSENQ